MINENFLSHYDDLILNRTLDYLRFGLDTHIPFLHSIICSLDLDNNSTCFRSFGELFLTFTNLKTPRGRALLIASSYEGRSVPLFFYEEYNENTIKNFGYSSRFDVYSSGLRVAYLQGLSLTSFYENVLLLFLPKNYVITRFDIAIDIALPFRSPIIQDVSLIFNVRKNTLENVTRMKYTYYVGNTSGFTRFFRVYDKTNDIVKNHKEFLFPDLLNHRVTRIEAQYGSKYRMNNFYDFLNLYFPKVGNTYFITPIIPNDSRPLSNAASCHKLIHKLSGTLTRQEIIDLFSDVLKKYYDGTSIHFTK